MFALLVFLVVLFALGALASLVRGIVIFLKTTEADLHDIGRTGPSQSSIRQNRMMWRRIQFQALAIAAAVLLLMLVHPAH